MGLPDGDELTQQREVSFLGAGEMPQGGEKMRVDDHSVEFEEEVLEGEEEQEGGKEGGWVGLEAVEEGLEISPAATDGVVGDKGACYGFEERDGGGQLDFHR